MTITTLSPDEVAAKFGITRPDEAAECWEGVMAEPGLYAALWACVPEYEAPLPQVSEEPCYGLDSIARFWGRFSPEHQQALIRLDATNNGACYADW